MTPGKFLICKTDGFIFRNEDFLPIVSDNNLKGPEVGEVVMFLEESLQQDGSRFYKVLYLTSIYTIRYEAFK